MSMRFIPVLGSTLSTTGKTASQAMLRYVQMKLELSLSR
jgi:hypothetical protein